MQTQATGPTSIANEKAITNITPSNVFIDASLQSDNDTNHAATANDMNTGHNLTPSLACIRWFVAVNNVGISHAQHEK